MRSFAAAGAGPTDGRPAAPVRIGALFRAFFRISLLVVGGGYAIAAAADETFGRRLRWLKEGEILDHLPIISTVPGLVAGNTAIYVGLRTTGRFGALAALAAVALPSYLVFSAVTLGLASLPQGCTWLEGAFLGLRSSLAGIVAALAARALLRGPVDWSAAAPLKLAPLSRGRRIAAGALFAVALALAAAVSAPALWAFLGFGSVCVGGGFPLVPLYERVFVGSSAPLLQMDAQAFSNLIAFTQMTPGPVSVNAATYFGWRLAGWAGGLVATAALLTPSYFLMAAALAGLVRGRGSRAVRLLLGALKYVSAALMLAACWSFAKVSVLRFPPGGGWSVDLAAFALAAFAAVAMTRRRMPIMALIAICAAAGAAVALLRSSLPGGGA